MSALPPSRRAAQVPKALFALAVFLLPITGLTGFDPLGELKGSASVYVFLLALAGFALFGRPGTVEVPRPVLLLAATFLAWLAIGTALNYETIGMAVLGDRSGVAKLATSSMVLMFGIALAILSGGLLRDPRDLQAIFLKPLTCAVLACAVFAVPEVGSWISPSATGLYEWTTALFHGEESEKGRVVGRLTSIAFEAPDLSYFAALTLPWLLLGCRWAWHAPLRAGAGVACAALIAGLALVALSNSRTGFLMLAALLASEAAFWFGLRRLRIPAGLFASVLAVSLLSGVVALAAQLSDVGGTAVSGEDVSTITRSALLTAQFSIFADHPLAGTGFGQYGFHGPDHLPPWAWASYEIERFFETRGELPPSFNMFGRIGSELGIPGLIIWFGFWIAAIHRIARAVPHLPDRSFALCVNAALLSSAICLTVGGISTDAFRRPETWVLVAITGLYAGSGVGRGRGLS